MGLYQLQALACFGGFAGGGWLWERLGIGFQAFDGISRQGPVGFGGFCVLDQRMDVSGGAMLLFENSIGDVREEHAVVVSREVVVS